MLDVIKKLVVKVVTAPFRFVGRVLSKLKFWGKKSDSTETSSTSVDGVELVSVDEAPLFEDYEKIRTTPFRVITDPNEIRREFEKNMDDDFEVETKHGYVDDPADILGVIVSDTMTPVFINVESDVDMEMMTAAYNN